MNAIQHHQQYTGREDRYDSIHISISVVNSVQWGEGEKKWRTVGLIGIVFDRRALLVVYGRWLKGKKREPVT
jgi:hypothetical protein